MWLWPGNRTFLEVASIVVIWWIVAFFAQWLFSQGNRHLEHDKIRTHHYFPLSESSLLFRARLKATGTPLAVKVIPLDISVDAKNQIISELAALDQVSRMWCFVTLLDFDYECVGWDRRNARLLRQLECSQKSSWNQIYLHYFLNIFMKMSRHLLLE